jgi:hypothetical protein
MKNSKFDAVYQKSYKIFLNEEAPIPSDIESSENTNNQEQPIQENPPEEQINQSQLPDPSDVIGVKTDMLKMFKGFFNIDPQRQEEFKRSIATKAIDDRNAESLIDQLKQFIAAGEKPKESSI